MTLGRISQIYLGLSFAWIDLNFIMATLGDTQGRLSYTHDGFNCRGHKNLLQCCRSFLNMIWSWEQRKETSFDEEKQKSAQHTLFLPQNSRRIYYSGSQNFTTIEGTTHEEIISWVSEFYYNVTVILHYWNQGVSVYNRRTLRNF